MGRNDPPVKAETTHPKNWPKRPGSRPHSTGKAFYLQQALEHACVSVVNKTASVSKEANKKIESKGKSTKFLSIRNERHFKESQKVYFTVFQVYASFIFPCEVKLLSKVLLNRSIPVITEPGQIKILTCFFLSRTSIVENLCRLRISVNRYNWFLLSTEPIDGCPYSRLIVALLIETMLLPNRVPN